MSTVAIAPTIVPLPPGVDPTALARKRRREILQSRAAQGVAIASSSPPEEQSPSKKAKIATDAAAASSETLRPAANSRATAGVAGTKNSMATKKVSNTGGAKFDKGSVTKKPQPTKKAEAKKTTKAPAAIAPPAKKVARASSSGGGHQARYDPDVPMTKEEASAWRREARRVRNRESAAASRAKTRNRIAELEAEVAEWKAKYERVEARLRLLEGSSSSAAAAAAGVAVAEVSTEAMAAAAAAAVAAALGEATSGQDTDAHRGRDVSGDVAAAAGFVSPLSSPVISSKPAPLSSSEKQQPGEAQVKEEGEGNGRNDEKMEEAHNDTKKQEQQQPQAHLNETISRPAVKTGAMREQHVLQTSEFLLLPPPSISIQDASPSPPRSMPSIVTDDSSSTGSCHGDAYYPSSSDVSILTVPSSSSFDDDGHGADAGIFDRHEDDKEINHMDRQLLFDALNGLVSEDGDFGAVVGV